jgi:hypothetical protein
MNLTLRGTSRFIYGMLPSWGRSLIGRADYVMASRARIFHEDGSTPPRRLQRGVLTLSIDFELAWAWQYAREKSESPEAKGLREREQIPVLLRLFDELATPVTWATVGHLFLERCECGKSGLAHEAMPRLQHFESDLWSFTSGDWFQYDPCTDAKRSPAWYGPDLVEAVLRSKVNHEIGCHGFSHAGFGSYCPPDVASAELQACTDAMAPFGVTPSTFVFPGNDVGHLSLFPGHGFAAVRAYPVPPAIIGLPVRLSEDLWGHHVTSAIDRGYLWSKEQRAARLCRFIETAARERLAAHIWFHPSMPPDEIGDVLEVLLRRAAALREKGLLDILTNAQLLAAVRGTGHDSGSRGTAGEGA